jgi:hypothetical protein
MIDPIISAKRIQTMATALVVLVLGAAAPAAGQERTPKAKHALPIQGGSPTRAATSTR